MASEDVGRPQDHRECLHDKTSRSLAGLNWLDRRLREKNHSNKNPDRHITAKMKVIKKVNKKEMKKKHNKATEKEQQKEKKREDAKEEVSICARLHYHHKMFHIP